MKRTYWQLTTLLVGALLTSQASAFGGLNLDLNKLISAGKNLNEASKDISEPEEISIGEGMASVLLGTAPLVKSDTLQTYVNQVGRYLSLQTERPDLPWHFGVLDSDSVNAFATPGGHIFITSGLLRKMHSEAELAGVLSHEIAHVLRKHHLVAMKKAGGMGFLTDVASIAVDQKGGGGYAGKELSKNLISGMKEILVRGLDKDDEYEADRMGVVIATRAGYDSYGLPAVLQMLDGLSNTSDVSLLFSTHPAPESRMDTLSGVMQSKFDHYQGQSVNDRFRRLMTNSAKK
ncbi:MAG: M48 family metalloprotease [Gammaproteobacteria bacterium]|nr:M48 family metalloprotease [Gammaproteobacteria bacterium]MBU1731973.1 M48 family metalloprotease [Gammaproteobacteria bacterium]MBU1893111.1 M48 family metalloprotease [Gammaproteobacteria bacterium]